MYPLSFFEDISVNICPLVKFLLIFGIYRSRDNFCFWNYPKIFSQKKMRAKNILVNKFHTQVFSKYWHPIFPEKSKSFLNTVSTDRIRMSGKLCKSYISLTNKLLWCILTTNRMIHKCTGTKTNIAIANEHVKQTTTI